MKTTSFEGNKMDNPQLPLEIIQNMKGVRHAFYLSKETLEKMRVEEATVTAAGGKIAALNQGFNEALQRNHVIAIIKDPRFRPPPEPTVVLQSEDGKILGEEVFPTNKDQYTGRTDIVWLFESFVLFPEVKGEGQERFVMPPVSFPELNESNGCKDVLSCSPAPTTDKIMREDNGYADDSRFASVLVAFNDCPVKN